MHLSSTRDLCQDVGDGKKRYDYQTYFTPFSTGNIYKGIRVKCLGCKICYMHYLPGGIGREPQLFEKIFPTIKSGVNSGKVELVTDLIEPFLNLKVVPIILEISEKLPEAKFNLITKLPRTVNEAIKKYPELNKVPYHIQVTTMQDGKPIPQIVENIASLLKVAKSVSCRVDPFVFGISSLEEFFTQIEQLANIGIKHITTNTMKVYRGQKKLLPDLNLEVYSDGDKAGSARIVNADVEYDYFKQISNQCKRCGVMLGVCMSRPEVRVFEAGPCEGIELNEYKMEVV